MFTLVSVAPWGAPPSPPLITSPGPFTVPVFLTVLLPDTCGWGRAQCHIQGTLVAKTHQLLWAGEEGGCNNRIRALDRAEKRHPWVLGRVSAARGGGRMSVATGTKFVIALRGVIWEGFLEPGRFQV